MIQAKGIVYSYSDKPIFDGARFTVGSNIKAGLVGPNGAGKSTLFKLILGEEQPREGEIIHSGKVVLVPQEVKHDPILDASHTVREYVDPMQKKEIYELQMFLHGLEMEHLDLNQKPSSLSGGQKTKLALARALIEEPDVLLLDEPTNFMDVAGKQWVMDFLSTYPKTLLLVSHDLYLMDHFIDKVLAINPTTHKIEEYKGTYSTYIRLKKEHDDQLKREIINEQKHIKHMERGLVRMQRFTSKKGVRQRTVLKRRIEKLKANLPDMPQELKRFSYTLPEPLWIGEMPLKVVGIGKSYGDNTVLSDVTFPLFRGQRIALIGYNGAGKSTLLKIVVGRLSPDEGEVLYDPKIKIGYYSQEFETFDLNKTLIETVEEHHAMREEKIRSFLAGFLFAGNKVYQKVESLSGGEKTRLAMALLLLEDYNVLILDEPTTYLDVLSQRIILEALKKYTGSILMVSHTEDFVRELTPDKALLLPENKFIDFVPELLDRVSEV